MSDHRKGIISALEKLTYGMGQDRIFEDFLTLCLISLKRLPEHLRATEAGEPMTDAPEDAATWKKIVDRYRPDAMDHFAKAFAELLLSTDDYCDTLGDVYMEWGHNKYAGQFFTPSHVAQLMAQMTMGDIEAQVQNG